MVDEPHNLENEQDASEPRVLRFPTPPDPSATPQLKTLPPLRTLPQFQPQRSRGIASPSVRSLWRRWDFGEKTMMFAACAAAISMGLPWLDFHWFTFSGISQEKYFYLGIFVYPVAMLLRQSRVNRQRGRLGARRRLSGNRVHRLDNYG